jgi:hypothetical protein
MNMAAHICTLFNVTTDDLGMMSLIMAEESELQREKEEDLKRKSHGGS